MARETRSIDTQDSPGYAVYNTETALFELAGTAVVRGGGTQACIRSALASSHVITTLPA